MSWQNSKATLSRHEHKKWWNFYQSTESCEIASWNGKSLWIYLMISFFSVKYWLVDLTHLCIIEMAVRNDFDRLLMMVNKTVCCTTHRQQSHRIKSSQNCWWIFNQPHHYHFIWKLSSYTFMENRLFYFSETKASIIPVMNSVLIDTLRAALHSWFWV